MSSIKQLADEFGTSVSAVKNYLRDNEFASSDRNFAGGDASLTRGEVRALREAWRDGRLKSRRGEHLDRQAKGPAQPEPGADAARDSISNADLAALTPAPRRASDGRPRLPARYPIFLHEELVESLDSKELAPAVKKNLTRRVQELAAHGRATRNKGVKGLNAGYLRVPVGGRSGQQYYLWLTVKGERVARQDSAAFHEPFPQKSRILRAVRHHDETAKPKLLPLGDFDDYHRSDSLDLMTQPEREAMVEPLIPEQREIVREPSDVRYIQGQPGAGKTTSLLATTRRLSGRMLYLTWNASLVEHARAWLEAICPAELDAEVWTFDQFVAKLDPNATPPERAPLSDQIQRLEERLGRRAAQLGMWTHSSRLRAAELYAELHAHVLGGALPVDFRAIAASEDGLVPKSGYLELRSALGPAAQQAHDALATMGADDRRALFPELSVAFERAHALRAGALSVDPSTFGFDWVLIDEVQDLALIQQWLVLDVIARAGALRQIRPGLIIAGDEAQTVRPTAFDWGLLRDLVRERFGPETKTSKHNLSANLRAPQSVARFIDRVRCELYSLLDKHQRPSGRNEVAPTDVTIGRILLVETDEARDELLRCFASVQSEAALIYPDATIPDALGRAAQDSGLTLWTPELAKGLEFRVVGVLGVPDRLREIRALMDDSPTNPLCAELARSVLDRFLVAVSRTTETLVLLADHWDEPALESIRELIRGEQAGETLDGCLERVSVAELHELILLDAADSRASIEGLLTQSAQLQARGEIASALRLADNANGLLGRAGRPGAAGQELRTRVWSHQGELLALAALAVGDPEQLARAAHRLRLAKREDSAQLLQALARLAKGEIHELDTHRSFRELSIELSVVEEHSPTLVGPITEAMLAHLERVATDVTSLERTPKGRAALVEGLEHLGRTAPVNRQRFATLEQDILSKLLAVLLDVWRPGLADEFAALRQRVRADAPGLPEIDARHAEHTGELEAAARAWEALERPEDALRCYRRTGDFVAAARLADRSKHPDAALIGWMAKLSTLLDEGPPGALVPEDERHLRERFDARFSRRKTTKKRSVKSGSRS